MYTRTGSSAVASTDATELAQHTLRQDSIYHFLRHHAVELIEGDASAVNRAEALHLPHRVAQLDVLERGELGILRRRLHFATCIILSRDILMRFRHVSLRPAAKLCILFFLHCTLLLSPAVTSAKRIPYVLQLAPVLNEPF